MKKTTNSSKRGKLSLNTETIRILTNQDLELVVGGACRGGSEQTQIPTVVQPPHGHHTTC